MDAPRLPLEGDRFGNWTIERTLDKGGMGMVYLAYNPIFGKSEKVALKVLNPAFADRDADFVRRFHREAAIVVRTHCPHLVSIRDAGRDDATGCYYIVMEYLGGGTLRDRMRREGPMPWRKALSIVRPVALALSAVAKRGSVHRDIKPENILFTTDGVAKLTDFGIAKVAREDALEGGDPLKTRALQVFGTPAYISPEQIVDASAVDARADIWSLGVVLFEMLAGERPYPARDLIQARAFLQSPEPIPDIRSFGIRPAEGTAHPAPTEVTLQMSPTSATEAARSDRLSEDYPTASSAQPASSSVPEGVVDLLSRMCDKNLAARMASWEDVVAAIDELLMEADNPADRFLGSSASEGHSGGGTGEAVADSEDHLGPRKRRALWIGCASLAVIVMTILCRSAFRNSCKNSPVSTSEPSASPSLAPVPVAPQPSEPVRAKAGSGPGQTVSNVVSSKIVPPKARPARDVANAPKVAAPKVAAPKVAAPKVVAPKVVVPKVAVPREIVPRASAPESPKASPPAPTVSVFEPKSGRIDDVLSRLDAEIGRRPACLKVSLSVLARKKEMSVERFEQKLLIPAVEHLRRSGVNYSLVSGSGRYGSVVQDVAKRLGCNVE